MMAVNLGARKAEDVLINVQHSNGSVSKVSVKDLYNFKQNPVYLSKREKISQRVQLLEKKSWSAGKVGIVASLICALLTATTLYFFGNTSQKILTILGIGIPANFAVSITAMYLQAERNHEREKKIEEDECSQAMFGQRPHQNHNKLKKNHTCFF